MFFTPARPLACAFFLVACLVRPALAQPTEAALDTATAESTRRWLDAEVAKAPLPADMPLRIEVAVGTLDARLRLAPCGRVEPYLPAGTRLWGKTRLGLRCLDGAVRWNVFLPVTVKAIGPAWVARGPIAAGATLAASDAMEAEVDWAEDNSPVVADAAQWIGTVTTRALNAGQPVRQGAIRQPQVFQAGTQVRVVAQGAGFAVTSDGQAVSAGVVGQPVRIRMDSGRLMTGTVLDSHTVRIDI